MKEKLIGAAIAIMATIVALVIYDKWVKGKV